MDDQAFKLQSRSRPLLLAPVGWRKNERQKSLAGRRAQKFGFNVVYEESVVV